MNDEAQKLVTQAKGYIAKGDDWYAKAADALLAARVGEKNGPTWAETARSVGKSDAWVKDLVRSRTKFKAGLGTGDFKVEWSRGSHGTAQEIKDGARKLLQTATVEEIRDLMQDVTDEQRDMILEGIMGTPEERKEKGEESERKLMGKHPFMGWAVVADGFGEANLGLVHSLDALVKLAINARIDSGDDALGVARGRAEKIGRSIHEIEMAWGENPITDEIGRLREGVPS